MADRNVLLTARFAVVYNDGLWQRLSLGVIGMQGLPGTGDSGIDPLSQPIFIPPAGVFCICKQTAWASGGFYLEFLLYYIWGFKNYWLQLHENWTDTSSSRSLKWTVYAHGGKRRLITILRQKQIWSGLCLERAGKLSVSPNVQVNTYLCSVKGKPSLALLHRGDLLPVHYPARL